MTKREALSRQKTLLVRGENLRQKLAGELANLRDFKAADSVSDSVDVAFEAENDEMSFQLAAVDLHELKQIERVLERMKQGKYGVCEGGSKKCQKRIPEGRLNALPYATLCINCEREMEKAPDSVRASASDPRGQPHAGRSAAHVSQGNAMATFGLIIGLMFASICYLWNVTDGEWPSGW
jgi:DnaK suppressor protein